jgi:hypothetical protein
VPGPPASPSLARWGGVCQFLARGHDRPPPPSAQNFPNSPKPSNVENLSRGGPKIQSNNIT